MSRARHRKRGGSAVVFAGEGSGTLREARERKRGGRVHHHAEGHEAKARGDKRHRGGKVHHSEKEEHEGKKHPGHHKGRARGGRVGADKHPLSSAAKIKEVTKGEYPEDSPKD